VSTTDVHERAASLARELAAEGSLSSPEWGRVVREVDRGVFVPSYVEQLQDGTWRAVSGDRPDTHEEWLAGVYANRPLTTALRTDADGNVTPISSSSKPGLMVRMLEALEVRDGHRVLEVGTGTGYNAGLLCGRLGAANVASVDVEADLVATARKRLASLGFVPVLAGTDGANGLPEAAPFDRIIATCSVARIPDAWVEQTTQDGRILTDVKITGVAGNLVDLHRTSTDMVGHFLPKWAGFMPLRSAGATHVRAARHADTVERVSVAPSARPWWDHAVAWFLAALELPAGVTTGMTLDPERRTPVAATMHAEDGSWAEVQLNADEAGRRIVRGSAEDLWATVERAYATWTELGEPGWEDFGLTVSEAEQRVWFRAPDSRQSWRLPDGR
jgi:protein-L-isoaspartate O-methyltransferase